MSSRFDALRAWAEAIGTAIQQTGFQATVVVGFSRSGATVVAKARRGVIVFADAPAEQAAVRQVPLHALRLAPAQHEALTRPGVHTVADFLRLHAADLHERFGAALATLHQQLTGPRWEPWQPSVPPTPLQEQLAWEAPEPDLTRLLFALKPALDRARTTLAGRRAAITALQMEIALEDRTHQTVTIRPAAPTLDSRELLELVRLRLETLALSAGVTTLTVTVDDTPATEEQLRLFREAERRDLTAANRALARLRATFGNEAVRRVRLREGHLPEARWTWEPLPAVVLPQPQPATLRPLLRRLWLHPVLLPPPPRHPRQGSWLLAGLEAGPVVRLVGSEVFSGGWWRREIHREYYFAETARGDLLWLFYDRRRRQWFLHGRVE